MGGGGGRGGVEGRRVSSDQQVSGCEVEGWGEGWRAVMRWGVCAGCSPAEHTMPPPSLPHQCATAKHPAHPRASTPHPPCCVPTGCPPRFERVVTRTLEKAEQDN